MNNDNDYEPNFDEQEWSPELDDLTDWEPEKDVEEEDREDPEVKLYSCGTADWPRWFIFHCERLLYWSQRKQGWICRPELWNDRCEAGFEYVKANRFADAPEINEEETE